MTILFAASEIAPEACTGGLGEVLSSLPQYLETQAGGGHAVAVALPGYPFLMHEATPLGVNFSLSLGDSLQPVSVFELQRADGTQVLLIHNEALFGRPGLYGDGASDYPDNSQRFIFFSRAVVELAKRMDPAPQVLHLNDWQTALVPALVREQNLPFKTVLTLHNVDHQGSFAASDFAFTNLPHHWMSPSGLEFYGALNLLKGGILTADVLTTPSANYRKRILSPDGGRGLHSVLQSRADNLYVIPNGLDSARWSPDTCSTIASPFSSNAPEGKSICRSALLSETNLLPSATGPVFAMFARRTDEKGLERVLPLLPKLLSSDSRLVIAGDTCPTFRSDLLKACKQHPHKLAFVRDWAPAFPQTLFAGADAFLAPSEVEPNSPTPLQALRMGCIPVAHASSNLLENLQDFQAGTGKGNSLLYFNDSNSALWDAIVRTKLLFQNKAEWSKPMGNALRSEFSWQAAADTLNPIYHRLTS
jgi:starch synthase